MNPRSALPLFNCGGRDAPARPEALHTGGAIHTEPDQLALLAAVRANPDDHTARLVYADWLDEHDDPLAQYARAEVAVLARAPGSPEWEAATRALFALTSDRGNFGGWEYAPDLARLRAKIDLLRATDTERTVFGVRRVAQYGHEYGFAPPAHEPELIAFELRHRVRLPGEYRAFVLRLGNGGVGPDYGLFALPLGSDLPNLSAPFGVSPELAAEMVAVMEAARAAKRWFENVPQPPGDVSGRGCLELCEHGCGNESVLIVNGPLSGRVWWQGDLGLVPDPLNPRAALGFFAWYERWLDRWLAPGAIKR